MDDTRAIEFLQWCLPQLGYRWAGFRKVRRQVIRRIHQRIEHLDLASYSAYQNYLQKNPTEWEVLDSFCDITISHFYRDRVVFDLIASEIFPNLIKLAQIKTEQQIRCWCIGCASGEEPYSLSIIWKEKWVYKKKVQPSLQIVATDRNPMMLKRALAGCYSAGSIKDLPKTYLEQAFIKEKYYYLIKKVYQSNILFLKEDIRYQVPEGKFFLILCRNMVFTYFSEAQQTRILRIISDKLTEGGFFVIGSHERLPHATNLLTPYKSHRSIFQKIKSKT